MNSIVQGDCLEVMAGMAENSVDAIVCDPPYGLTQGKKGGSGPASLNTDSPAGRSRITTGFMGLSWDGATPPVEVWQQALRVLKPGGYLLAFGGTRTYHRMAVAVEDAGFILHPMIAWIHGQGFPKATNLSKQLDKRAGAEREVVGDKLDRPGYHLHHSRETKFGDGKGLYAGCDARSRGATITAPSTDEAKQWDGWFYGRQSLKPSIEPVCMAQKPPEGRMVDNVLKWGTGAINVGDCAIGTETIKTVGNCDKRRPVYDKGGFRGCKDSEHVGRWPSNVIHDGSEEVLRAFDAAGDRKAGGAPSRRNADVFKNCYGLFKGQEQCPPGVPGSSGSASRFFYCAKASTAERGEGNGHPTVKPLALMRYLVRLVTPPGGLVLDPFAGSGSTLVAAKLEGFQFMGIELSAEYVEIIRGRLEPHVSREGRPTLWREASG